MRDPRPLAGSGSLQAEKALHRREVTVAVQQGVTAFDTECADEEVYRRSDRDPAAAQEAIVCSRFDRQLRVDQRDCFEPYERPLNEPRLRVGRKTLQNLAQDQVSDQQRRCRYQLSKPADRLGDDIIQKIDPDGAVDEDHVKSRP
jgi:hypothetical protein